YGKAGLAGDCAARSRDSRLYADAAAERAQLCAQGLEGRPEGRGLLDCALHARADDRGRRRETAAPRRSGEMIVQGRFAVGPFQLQALLADEEVELRHAALYRALDELVEMDDARAQAREGAVVAHEEQRVTLPERKAEIDRRSEERRVGKEWRARGWA